jgi:hypothetical protein
MKSKFAIAINFFFFICIVSLFVGLYFLYSKLEKDIRNVSKTTPSVRLSQLAAEEKPKKTPEITDACGKKCKEEIAQTVSRAVATLSGTTTVIQEVPVVPTQTVYIPLGATAMTTSIEWVDVDDSSFYIDVIGEYGDQAKVSWETSLKVAHGNGKAFARLYDGTNNIAVDFSELSTENNASYERVSSGSLPFWRGRNLYKVQIKSLNSFEVTYSGGRVKVSY